MTRPLGLLPLDLPRGRIMSAVCWTVEDGYGYAYTARARDAKAQRFGARQSKAAPLILTGASRG